MDLSKTREGEFTNRTGAMGQTNAVCMYNCMSYYSYRTKYAHLEQVGKNDIRAIMPFLSKYAHPVRRPLVNKREKSATLPLWNF